MEPGTFGIEVHTENEGISELHYEKMGFSGGEVHVRIIDIATRQCRVEEVWIGGPVLNSDQMMELFLLTNAIREYYYRRINVNFQTGYLPYARQDRVCSDGEALSIKVFCDLLNIQDYKRVLILDPHSDVTPALINNCHVIQAIDIITQDFESAYGLREILNNPQTILVSPDAGANKKTLDLAKEFGGLQVVRADKVRDTKTGDITGTEVFCDDFEGKDVLIPDDICDGGRTFIELSKVLKTRNVGKVYLYVSHGIFSKGLEVLEEHFDHIWTTDSFPNKETDKEINKGTDKLSIIKL